MNLAHNIHNKWESLGFVPSSNPTNNSSNNKWESLGFVPSNNSPVTLEQSSTPQSPEQAQSEDYSKFQGEDSFGRSIARVGKNVASIAGAPFDVANSLYNAVAMPVNSITNSIAGSNLLPIAPNASNEIRKAIDTTSQGYTATPEDKKYLETAQDFTAETLAGGLANFLKSSPVAAKKFMSMFGSTKGKDLAGAAAAGGVSQMSQDKGDNPLMSAIYGFLANLSVTNAAAIKKAPNAIKGGLAKATGYGPENINLKIADSYEKVGLEPKNTVVNKSPNLLSGEKLLNEIPYFGTKNVQNLKEIDNNYSKLVHDTLETAGKRISHADNPGDIIYETGKALKDMINA